LLTASSARNRLVGVVLADCESTISQSPAATLDQVRAFVAADMPATASPRTDPTGVFQAVIAVKK
jgi:hypothetical protein